jgi:hypothetical protein
MPQFEIVSLEEAMTRAATSRRARMAREYLSYIEQLGEGQAGRLKAVEGEKLSTIRRRLIAAAKLAGKSLKVKRVGEELYFWIQPAGEEPVTGGRRRRKTGEQRG